MTIRKFDYQLGLLFSLLLLLVLLFVDILPLRADYDLKIASSLDVTTSVLTETVSTKMDLVSPYLIPSPMSGTAQIAAQSVYTIYFPLTHITSFETQVVDLINVERADSCGASSLTINSQLSTAAYGHSVDMGDNDFFGHVGTSSNNGGERITAQGYNWSSWAENIAAGQSTPADVVVDWMESPTHKAHILDCSFTETGVGYYYLDNDSGSIVQNHYWTQLFAKPK